MERLLPHRGAATSIGATPWQETTSVLISTKMDERRAIPMLTICNQNGFACTYVRTFKGSC